ncbi:MAG: HlyD family efflux transporter periplasmic adaptor subunit, partial [Rhodothermales bacterium]|nr:HlyD family efflux transporter periplasmic adaptor subunit [Rhodothermales bacterium]
MMMKTRTDSGTASVTRWIILAVICTTLSACSSDNGRADAYGNFEATEIVVSAAATGRILSFDVEEGQNVAHNTVVGVVDTVQLALQKSQLVASRSAVRSRVRSVDAQIAVLNEQRAVAERDRDRIERLLADAAATQKQLDDVEGQIAVIDRQVEQARTQVSTIRAEITALEAQIARVQDQIREAIITNPITGTVLTTYAEPQEMTTYGKPLYKIADLTTMTLRAYVAGDQLPDIRIGQQVEVRVDRDRESEQSLDGRITWISSEAEFTPKLIQTKEERVNLVYAFKVN